MLPNIKTTLGLVATSLVVVGYIPYLSDIIKEKTKPHLYSWIVWSLVTFLVFMMQFNASAGSAAFATLASCLMCLTVLAFGILYKSKVKIFPIDNLFLVLALIALVLWLVAKNPIASTILITIVNFLAFLPTIRKSWFKPFSETIFLYYFNAFRYFLTILAIQRYNLLTSLYIFSCFITTTLFIIMVNWRRKNCALEPNLTS